jgi:uncharacterized membrane protein YhaH (DUF805 family)
MDKHSNHQLCLQVLALLALLVQKVHFYCRRHDGQALKPPALLAGTQFTGFTGTKKVRILTELCVLAVLLYSLYWYKKVHIPTLASPRHGVHGVAARRAAPLSCY